jgi:hypothetical protein
MNTPSAQIQAQNKHNMSAKCVWSCFIHKVRPKMPRGEEGHAKNKGPYNEVLLSLALHFENPLWALPHS